MYKQTSAGAPQDLLGANAGPGWQRSHLVGKAGSGATPEHFYGIIFSELQNDPAVSFLYILGFSKDTAYKQSTFTRFTISNPK